MHDNSQTIIGRRAFLGGATAGGVLLLPGCATLGGFGFTDAIRRILTLSSERAFARLLSPDGYWDEQVERIGLGTMLGGRGDVLSGILTSALFKDRLADAFADVAVEGAARAAPVVAETIRTIGIENAIALINGGPSAATDFLRGEMALTLAEVMVPEVSDALRLAEDPLVGQAITALTGIDFAGAATNFTTEIDNAIWREMGVEEAAIRADPASTNDPVIIGVLGAGGVL